MRIKQLIPGFNNSQKIRFVVDGFAMQSTIQDVVFNVQSKYHSAAIADALQKLAHLRRSTDIMSASTGLACTAFNGCQVQVDLV